MNVLSLFDGISCGRVALERAGIKIDAYYACEINKDSIKITQKNYPDTIQLGDVQELTEEKLKLLQKIDLLIGGSPCENLTICAIDRPEVSNGLEGKKSILFFEYARILDLVKPKYFLLENVASMKRKNKEIITKTLSVEPHLIDSNLVSAQDRERLYWTNIPNVTQPEDKKLVLKDIMEENVLDAYFYNKPFTFHGYDKKVIATLEVNSHDIVKRVYNPNNKCGTLTAINGGYQEKKVFDKGRVRKLTPLEYERLQTLPEGYTYGVSETSRRSLCGDGWTVDVLTHIFKNIKTNK